MIFMPACAFFYTDEKGNRGADESIDFPQRQS
jgi:hypothetical protein